MSLKNTHPLNFFYKLLDTPDLPDEKQTQAVYFLVRFAWINILIFPLGMLGLVITAPEYSIRPAVTALAVIAVYSFVLILLRHNKVKVASYLVIGFLWVIVSFLSSTGGGVKAPSYLGYLVVAFLAGILLGSKALFIVTGLSIFSGLFFVFLANTGQLPIDQYEKTPFMTWNIITLLMIFQVLLQAYNQWLAKRSLERVQAELVERARVEQSLHEREIQLNTIFEATPVAIEISRLQDGKIISINTAFENLYGYSRLEVIGRTTAELDIWAIAADRQRFIDLLKTEGIVQRLETTASLKSGEKRYVFISGKAVDINGEPCMMAQIIDNTESKLAEEKLRFAESRYRALIENAPDGIVLVGANDKFQYASPSVEKLFGYSQDSMLNLNPREMTHPEDLPNVMKELSAILVNPDYTAKVQYRFLHKNGEWRWIESTFSNLLGSPSVAAIIINFRDIHERKQAEEGLKKSQGLLTEAERIGHIGYMEWNGRNQDLICSDEIYNLLELPLGASINQHVIEKMMKPGEAERIQQLDRQAMQARVEMDYEYCIQLKNGRARWLHQLGRMSFDEQGTPNHMLAIIQDVTERKQAEENVTYRQQLLEKVIQLGKEVTSITDLDQCLRKVYESVRFGLRFERVGIFLYTATTSYAQGVWGTSREGQMEENTWYNQPVDPHSGWARTLQSPAGIMVETDYQATYNPSKDNEMYGVKEHISVAAWAGNVPIALISTDNLASGREIQNADIEALHLFSGYAGLAIENARLQTGLEQRVRERTAELRQSQEDLQKVLDSANDLIQSLDESGRYLYVNAAWCETLGYTPQEARHMSLLDIVDPLYREHCVQLMQELIDHATSRSIEVVFHTKQGAPVLVEGHVSTHVESNGRRVTQGFFRNITERKQAELALQASLKRVNSLYAISQSAIQSRDLNALAQLITDTLVVTLPANRVSIFIIDEHKRRIELQTKSGLGSASIVNISFDEAWDGLSGWALREGKATLSSYGKPDERESVDVQKRRAETECGDIIVAPLIYQDQLLGTITVINQIGEQFRFTPDDLELTGAIANQASLAIERIRTEISLHQANQALEHSLRMKDDFLANMSHELRTPLNGILGMTEILQEEIRGPLNERQHTMVKIIETSGQHLLSLINDILDLSKIEAGKIELHKESTSITDLCQSSLAFIKEAFIKKGIAIEFEPDPLADRIEVDTRRMKQILVNLLSNAVKFTPTNGMVTLSVSGHPQNHSIELAVRDTGIGIAPNDLQRLFTPFTQVDSSLTRQHEGTGLGLALTKKLTELHGGSIRVESQIGQGSTFTISIPWAHTPIPQALPSLSETPATQEAPIVATTKASQKILLADDNQVNLTALGDYLESKGYNLIYAVNGQEAFEKTHEHQPDLILMDVQMPVMDGLEAIRRLRVSPFDAIPIIALTAMAMSGDGDRCLQAGATAYMSKPVSLKKLAEMIATLTHENLP